MDIRDMIYHLLAKLQKCEVKEEAGIWYVTTPEGEKWDMTVPMRSQLRKKKSKR